MGVRVVVSWVAMFKTLRLTLALTHQDGANPEIHMYMHSGFACF